MNTSCDRGVDAEKLPKEEETVSKRGCTKETRVGGGVLRGLHRRVNEFRSTGPQSKSRG